MASPRTIAARPVPDFTVTIELAPNLFRQLSLAGNVPGATVALLSKEVTAALSPVLTKYGAALKGPGVPLQVKCQIRAVAVPCSACGEAVNLQGEKEAVCPGCGGVVYRDPPLVLT